MMKKSQNCMVLSSAKMDFHHVAGPRNVICACKCLCRVYPLELGKVKLQLCISGWRGVWQLRVLPHSLILENFDLVMI